MKSLEITHLTSKIQKMLPLQGASPLTPSPPPWYCNITHCEGWKVLKLLIWHLDPQKMLQLQGASPLTPSSPWCCYITHWKDGSLEIAHLTTRNSENASASGGKPLTPSPPHVTNNGKHKKNLISCRFCVIEKTEKWGRKLRCWEGGWEEY